MQTISIIRQRFALPIAMIIGTILQEACITSSGQRTRTDPSSVGIVPSSRSDSTIAIPFPNVFRIGMLTYDFRSSSIVQSTAGDSAPRADTSDATAVITVSFTSSNSSTQLTQATIQVDSARLVGESPIPQDILGPYIITAIPERAVQISKPAAKVCTLQNPQFLSGDEPLPGLPVGSTLSPQWTDTTRYGLCRGGILLQVTRISDYRSSTALEHQDDSITIVRSTKISLEGRGIQWQQSVSAAGNGVSTDTLTISHQRLLNINGMTNIEFTFRSDFRTQSFRQNSKTYLRARQ